MWWKTSALIKEKEMIDSVGAELLIKQKTSSFSLSIVTEFHSQGQDYKVSISPNILLVAKAAGACLTVSAKVFLPNA